MPNQKEKRRHKRYAVNAPVEIERLGTSPDPAARDKFRARLFDLSQGGVRIETRELVQPGETVRLLVAHADDFELRCTGRARWTNKVTGGYHTGVEFTSVDNFKTLDRIAAGAANPEPSAPQPPSTAQRQASKDRSSDRPSSPG